MRNLIILGALFLLSKVALSAPTIEIDDFFGRLGELDRLYENITFKDAFTCGEKATFQAAKDLCEVTCQPSGPFTMCQSECLDPIIASEMVTIEVMNCKEDSVTLFSSDGDIRIVTKDDFMTYKKNPIRELLQQLPQWMEGAYKVTFNSSYRGEHTLGWKTENERTVPALFYRVTIDSIIQGSSDFKEAIVTVIPDSSLPWFVHAARVRLQDDGTMWRLQDVQ